MRRSSFSDAEITDVVRALEAGSPAHELCNTWQISMRTLYRWKRKFGGLKPFAVVALRRLEQENHRLKMETEQTSSPTPPVAAAAPSLSKIRSDVGVGHKAEAPVVIGRFASLRLR